MSNSGDSFNYGEGTGSSPNKIDFLKKIGKKVDDTVGKAKSKVINTAANLAIKGTKGAIKGAAKVVKKVGTLVNKGKSDDTEE